MLQTIHRYYRSVLGAAMIGAISLSMLFFGMDFGGSSSNETYAIKVDEHTVSFSDFNGRKREVQDQLRRSLGPNYFQIAGQLLQNLDRQLVDSIIDEQLISKHADQLELHAGTEEVRAQIRAMFPNGFSMSQYRTLLSNLGTSAAAFEHRMGQDIVRSQYAAILQDVSLSSKREAKELLTEEETAYDIEYIALSADNFLSSLEEPAEEDLVAYYEENATDYETVPQVAYRFVSFEPKNYSHLVEISDDDIEFYYSDNERKFSTPERVRVRQIKLALAAGATPDKELGVSALADEIHEKLLEGESFDELVKTYSDDAKSKKAGGDIGWVKRGDLEPKFEKELFENKDGGFTSVLRNNKGFFIYSVEDYEAPSPKRLAEVREEIEKLIKTQEAPAFLSAHVEELYDTWTATGDSLEAFAKSNELKSDVLAELSEKTTDPTGLPGLTAKVIANATLEKQVIELREKTLLVEIIDFSDTHIPPFEDVKERVTADLKQELAFAKAKEEARALFASATGNNGSFDTLKLPEGVTKESKTGLKRKTPGEGPLADSRTRDAVFAMRSAGLVGNEPVTVNGKHYVVRVSKVTPPEQEGLKEKLEEYQETASTQLAQNLSLSLSNQMRRDAVIDINSAVYNQ